MDKAAFQSRLGAVVVNERLARSERPKRGMVNRMSIARLVAELRTLNVWEAFSRKYRVGEINGDFYDDIGKIE